MLFIVTAINQNQTFADCAYADGFDCSVGRFLVKKEPEC